ncbi:hypothetical protein R1flu_014297 [Riccia fluitans]|uniref:7-dehydrocholesterol reductase n=1 Tax=Riccia fluitans TaxID=41844 RepID=A0ABD1YFQ0_9MARC
MGVTSPRFESPTRFARATRLATRTQAAMNGNGNPMTSSSNISTAYSHRVTLLAIACMIVICPPLVIFMWYTHIHLDGSVLQLRSFIRNENGLSRLGVIWPIPSLYSFKMIGFFAFLQAALQIWLPGAYCFGPATSHGNRPLYKKNGFAAFWITMLTSYISWREKIFDLAVIYDHLGEIISASICISIVLSFLLYLKGWLAPSSIDSGTSGSAILDIFWGRELHPRLGRSFDLKVFFNSRIGMMAWALLVLGYMCKQVAIPTTLLGLISIFILFDCDNQRTRFRETDGKCRIWGKPPTKVRCINSVSKLAFSVKLYGNLNLAAEIESYWEAITGKEG